MKRQSIWLPLLLLEFAATGTGFAQVKEIALKEVEWPGLERTTAVCIEKDGLYVCVLPQGEEVKDGTLRIFNEAGEVQPAKLLYWNKDNGMCLLEIAKSLPAEGHLTLSTHSDFVPGQALTSLLPKSRLKTRIAGRDREYLGEELTAPMLRIRMGPGEKCEPGTPLINQAGELEGLVANHSLPDTNEGHAIPAGVIRKVITDMENHQKSGPVWVGMIFQSGTSTPHVIEVKKNSPADDAGIKPGDVILEVNGRSITELRDLIEILKLLPGEKSATVKVMRDLDDVDLEIVPRFVE